MRTTFIFSLLLTSLNIYGQNKMVYNETHIYTQSLVDSILRNPDLVASLQDFKLILESNPELMGWPKYYKLMSSKFFHEAEFDSTIYYADKSHQSYAASKNQRMEDERAVMSAFINKAAALKSKKDYAASITFYQKASDLTTRHEYKWKGFIISGIADNHLALGNDTTALQYYLSVSRDTNYMSLSRSAVTTLTRIGTIYHGLEKDESSILYYRRALAVSHQSDYKRNIPAIYGNIGGVYHDQKNIDSTIYYFKESIESKRDIPSTTYPNEPIYQNIYKSYISIHEGNYQLAIDTLQSVIQEINEISALDKNDKLAMLFALETLSLAYTKAHITSGYNEIFTVHTKFMDRFHYTQIKNDITNLELTFQNKNKDELIHQLEENRKQQNTIIEQRNLISYGIAALFATTLLFIIYYWRQRNLNNQYERENLKQRLLRSQMNPHFVFNALNSVCASVEQKSDKVIPYIQNLAGLFRLMLTNSREEFVDIEDEIKALEYYLNVHSNFSEKFQYSIRTNGNIERHETIIPPMLIQPFVENAIVHGFKLSSNDYRLSITFEAIENEKIIECTIIDNGVGFDSAQQRNTAKNHKHKSVSTDIIIERLEILKKKFKVDSRCFIHSSLDDGTRVQIFLPYFLE